MTGHILRIRPKAGDQHSDLLTNPLGHAKRVLLYFLQEIFRDYNPTGLQYMDDAKETKIIIKGAYGKNQETYNKKPLVVVDRSNAQIMSRTLGSIDFVDYRTGGYTRTEQVPFSLVARVYAENEYVVEKIAWYISSTVFLLRHVLIRQGFLYIGNQMVIGAVGAPVGIVPGDQANSVMIQLQLPCSHLATSRFVPINRPRLTAVGVKLQDAETGTQLAPDPDSSQE